uniref:Acyltransferase 3 domain-containing protein n=1 Tax=Plectus sambesii TaxID=2011161 RepID=A0A914W1X5_9BILA
MDFILDQYVFNYLPFNVSEAWRKSITDRAVNLVVNADWWCKAQDPRKIIDNHTSFFAAEIVFFFLCALTFIHAWRKGGRYLYVWIGILIHALNVENLCYWIPDLDNFWQAQGILTFFGMRAPLYILLGIYHMFDYTAYVFVRRMRLPWWAEGPAVGLGAVMLDMPYDIMGIKLLWWTWHDTDPNLYDRMYWVPWNSYYFHASFACSFVWILTLARKFLVPREYDWKLFIREFICVFLAGTGAFWLGTLQFGLLYHPMHDYLKVHSEITTCIFLATYAVIVYVADRQNKDPLARPLRGVRRYWFDELALAVCVHYLFYMVLVLVADPLNIVAEGLHQPIGPCHLKQSVLTPSGLVLTKDKYLCPTRYDEKMFDFHCLPEGPT